MNVENSQVESILEFYKYIDFDIQVASEWLEKYETGYNPLGAVVYDGMPHGNTLSDSTALLAVKLAETDTRESIDTLKKRIKELEKLRTEIFKEISALMPIHKTIISGFYIKGQKWEHIAEQINYSVRHSKNIRCAALEVLGAKFTRNRKIIQSKIVNEIIE